MHKSREPYLSWSQNQWFIKEVLRDASVGATSEMQHYSNDVRRIGNIVNYDDYIFYETNMSDSETYSYP